MASRRRQGRGKQQHAEGMHGDRTHEALIEQLHSGGREAAELDGASPAAPSATPEGARDAAQGASDGRQASTGRGAPARLDVHAPGPDGKHRLSEDREQHDPADLGSEKNRAARRGSSRAARSAGANPDGEASPG